MMSLAHEYSIQPGAILLQDGGYQILSGLSLRHPWIHGRRDLQIAPVRGTIRKNPRFTLPQRGRDPGHESQYMNRSVELGNQTDHHSILHIRGMTPEEAKELSNTWFIANGQTILLGPAREVELHPVPHLHSRLTVLNRIFLDETSDAGVFVARLRHNSQIPPEVEVTTGRTRVLSIRDKNLIGCAVGLYNLPPEESLRIQGTGIGKCTSMGCGVYYPGSPKWDRASTSVAQ